MTYFTIGLFVGVIAGFTVCAMLSVAKQADAFDSQQELCRICRGERE